MQNGTKVVAYRLINYSEHWGKNLFKERKKKRKQALKSGKSISKAKLIPISVMVGPNKPETVGNFPGYGGQDPGLGVCLS